MADEYIRKADVVSIAESYEVKRDGFHLNDYEYGRNQVADSIASDLEDMSPADVAPVVHGEWLPTNDDNKKRCNKCDTIVLIAMYPTGNVNYCPNCGAKMDEYKEE